jgi:hypothetical protein
MNKMFAALLGLVPWLLSSTIAISQISPKNFKVDDWKPYVYIDFDHLGERKTVDDWGSTHGLWLRLKNNCRIPITVSALDWGTGDPGAALPFEVVPYGGIFGPDPEQWKKMPHGFAADFGTRVTILPGKDFLFSVPAESVSKHWYIQVRFDFQFPDQKEKKGSTAGHYEPYSVANFEWTNIPESQRPPSADEPVLPPISLPEGGLPKIPPG